MGRQIPIYATADDVNQMVQSMCLSYPDLTRYDYHKGYIGLYDSDLVRQRYYLAHRVEFEDPFEPEKRSVEITYNSYMEIPDPADRIRFGRGEGRIYLNTWDPLPEQIKLYDSFVKYIKKKSWRFTNRRTVYYVPPCAMKVIRHLQQQAGIIEGNRLFEMLSHCDLIPPRSGSNDVHD